MCQPPSLLGLVRMVNASCDVSKHKDIILELFLHVIDDVGYEKDWAQN